MSNFTWADELGRAMARSDMEKNAHEGELASVAAQAGEELAKTANPMLAGIGAKMLDFAKKNPGVAIGGGLGALHGLMKHDGGVGSALTEGAVGAGLGYGGQVAMANPGARAIADVAKERAVNQPHVSRFIDDVYAKRGLPRPDTLWGVQRPKLGSADLEKEAAPSADKIRKAMSSASPTRVGRFADKMQGHIEKRLEKVHKGGPDKTKHLERAESLNKLKEDAEGAKMVKNLRGPAQTRDNYKAPPKPKPTMRVDRDGRVHQAPDHGGSKGHSGITPDHVTGGLVGGTVGYVSGAAVGHHVGKQSEKERQARREKRRKEKEKSASMADELEEIAETEKTAFGAAIAGALRSAVPAAMNFVKSNPLKAGLGAASAFGNFRSARQNGEGIGGALLSGAAGAASAL
jgi:gas vesicle protein